MKVGVIGGTGAVGRHFLRIALERKHELTVLARTPSKLDEYAENESMTIIQGNSTSAEDIAKIADGVDVVVSMVGNTLPYKDNLIMEKTVDNILKCHPKRVLALTSLGMGGSSPVVRFMLRMIGGSPSILDYEAADLKLREGGEGGGDDSNTETTKTKCVVVRPTALSDDPPTGKYEASAKGGMRMKPISRADVALFLVDMLDDETWDGGPVHLYFAAAAPPKDKVAETETKTETDAPPAQEEAATEDESPAENKEEDPKE